MRKQEHINHGLQTIDDGDGDEIQGNWFEQQPGYRDREEDQQRRQGLDIDMTGAKDEKLG